LIRNQIIRLTPFETLYMNPLPQKDAIVYSRDGARARFVAKVESYYLVYPEIEIYGWEDRIETDWGNIAEWNEIFPKPPVAVLDKEITEKQGVIKELTDKARLLYSKINEVESAIRAQKDKFARHEKLKYLEDFIDGKVTHYVKMDYYSVKIVEHGKEIWEDNRSYDRHMRLVTLCGNSKGDLSWMLNQYRDGSGSNGTTIIPCPSYEVALEEVRKLVSIEEQKFLKDGKFDEWIVTGAQKIEGIAIPEVFVKYFAEKKEQTRIKQLHAAKERLEKTKKEVLDLEAGIPSNCS
jgi:hypothetical protein